MATRHKVKTVLVIEDEADIRNFAFRVLELEGYHVLQASDGNEGLRLVRKNRGLSLVLLDLRLPGRDGWVVLQEMKKDPELSAIPVVVFSALAAAWQRRRALGMGAAAYLTKPVDATSLKRAVSSKVRWEGVMSACRPENH
ncbi:MAG: response regulator [Dehalococcoidales bacterium]|nr:response regulator [Dehalococcoidales bacterium]